MYIFIFFAVSVFDVADPETGRVQLQGLKLPADHSCHIGMVEEDRETGAALSQQQVAQLNQNRGRSAKDCEQVSEHFLNTAWHVYERFCFVFACAPREVTFAA